MAGEITAGICTSGSAIKVALCAAGRCDSLSKRERNQERSLLPMLERLLKKRKAALKDLTALCVITGPGRFTGLRISLTFAAALKTLAGIKVYSSTLFEILAMQACSSEEFRARAGAGRAPRLAAIVHAFKDEYFCQAFSAARGAFKAAGEPRWLTGPGVGAFLEGLGRGTYVIADAEEKPDIYSLVPAGFAKAPAALSGIRPEFIIRTGLALKNKDLKPLYLKPAKYEQESKKAGKQESKKAGKQESKKAGKQESKKAGKQESKKAGEQESRRARE